MASVFLFAILITISYVSIEYGRRTARVGDIEMQLQQDARGAMQEMLKDFREADPLTMTIYDYTDPQNGERHQAIAIASARGNPGDTVEGTCWDSVSNNACFHVDGTGNASWRSLIVYAPHETSDGRKELRRYADFRTAYGTGNHFPFTFTNITSNQIVMSSAQSLNVSFDRDTLSGITARTVMENLATEDADNDALLDTEEDDGTVSLPADNEDGALNYGADFSLNGRVLTITLFLRKRDYPASTASRFIISTLSSSIELRN